MIEQSENLWGIIAEYGEPEDDTNTIFIVKKNEANKNFPNLKKLFGTNYHVSDSCDLIMYTGCQRVADARNDIFRPSHMDVRFTVRYTQDRQTPETSAQ